MDRRRFLKSGLTAGMVPLASAWQVSASAAEAQTGSEASGVLVALPERLQARDLTSLSWEQKVRRVGADELY